LITRTILSKEYRSLSSSLCGERYCGKKYSSEVHLSD
jgi:hypothetical protein